MKNFEIDTENNVRMLDSGEVSASGAGFQNAEGLRKITVEWPLARLVEVWNRLPGVAPVKKFKDRKTACGRIWKAVAQQEATVGAQGAQDAPKATRAPRKGD